MTSIINEDNNNTINENNKIALLKEQIPCTCEKCKLSMEKNCLNNDYICKVCTDDRCSRFLIGCKGDVGKAAHILTGSLIWRYTTKADEAIKDTEEAKKREELIQSALPYTYNNLFDKLGNAIYIEITGLCDVNKMLEIGAEEFLTNHIRVNEKCIKNKTGKRLVILDLIGLNASMLRGSGFGLLKQMIDLDQRHYPESMYKTFIINAPWLLSTAFEIVKPWLDPLTLTKIHILGEGYMETLREHIELDQLPRYLGGILERPFGCLQLKPNLRRGALKLVDENSFDCPAGTSYEYNLPIPANVDEITYLLRSASYAITLRMSLLIKGIGTKTILRLNEYQCHETCIVGTYNIKENLVEGGNSDKDLKIDNNDGGGGERVLTIFVDNLQAWMYGLKIFTEIRDSKTGKLLK